MVVSFEEFKKLDIRVVKVIKAEDHPNADKLYLVTVEIGQNETKTLVAGIKGHYSKEELTGKLLILVNNLEPATIRGVRSEGMILAASDKDKKRIVVLTPDKPIESGSLVS